VTEWSAESGPGRGLQIMTPDQRIRVFVSSTLSELAEERRAARDAIVRMRMTPVMFEVGARPHSARALYRAYLAQSDVFVGIYWQKYGWVAPTESVSGLEDEYRLSADKPRLIYVKNSHDREPQLTKLLAQIQHDDRASYKHFSDAAELGELLADDLAVLLTERFAAAESPGATDLPPADIPVPPTEIVGRDAERETIGELLRQPAVRLVTLLGPGGVGKTRLALAIASDIKPAEYDTVRFVDLTAVNQPRLVLDAIGAALGVHAQGPASILDLLIERLRDRRILVVLDNFEHLSEAAPDVARLLAGCPGITALVTSRSALQIRGEHEVSLAPLELPPANESLDVAAIGRSAAVSLFVQAARGVRPDFTLDRENAAAIAELCRRLDGVPLAIELAAAQLRVLTPAALLRRLGERLDRSLDLTTGSMDLPARQHTLRATLEWSYGLLADEERALLSRLSVFAGSWSAEGAQAVGGLDEDAVLGTLSSLVAQSLVSVRYHDGSEPRFTMLDTVRVYASERLRESDEEQACLARLDRYLREFVALAGPELRGPENREWADRVSAELNDLRRALSRAVAADDPETIIALTGPLFTYWWSHGLLGEMRQLAEVASELPSTSRLEPEAAASLQWARGMFRVSVGQLDEAQPLLRQVVDATKTDADPWLHAHALAGLGIASATTDVEEAKKLLDDALDTFRAMDDRWGLTYALSARGQLAVLDGDPVAATKLHREGLKAADDIANDYLYAQLLDQLGLDAMTSGDLTSARDSFGQAAEVHAQLLDQEDSSYSLDGLAAVALAHQRPEVAARLLGASAHARELVGVAVWPALKPLAEALRAAVAAALGEAEFAQATALGAQMRLNEALAYALDSTSPEPAGSEA